MTGQALKSPKNIFGYDTYRPQQKEIIEGLIQGEDAGVPPFVVFSDVSLAGMAAELPKDDEAFLNVHGVGAHKLERYGEQFPAEIRGYLSEREGRGA